MSSGALPQEVVLAIERVLELRTGPDIDPLDTLSDDFDPVQVLNELFPNEESLGQINVVQARLAQNEHDLQQEIDSLQDELRRDQDPSRMQLIQEMISELFGQMTRIREKATESEAVVRNITKDIQVLDLAKKNLILSMTTLKRLQMLVNALTQLEDLVKDKKYAEISQTLAAVKQISALFKTYTSVKHIAQVWKRVQELQGELRTQIDADFDAFYLQDTASNPNSLKPAVIADACLVVDVLGADVRTQLIDRYVAFELKEYRRIFRPTDEAGGLDNLSRRFAWFRRTLGTHEIEQGRVFPSEWRVGWYMLAKFVDITRDDITTLLSKAGGALSVKVLLDTLQIIGEFESSMAKKWATPFSDILKETAPSPARVAKPISSACEQHMGVFVDAQDKALADMLAPHRGSKASAQTRTSLDVAPTDEEEGATPPPVTVLPSSTELFYFYVQSLEQCAKLSTGKPLFDLCTLHKKWLKIYAEDVLVASMKQRPAFAVRRSMDNRFDVNELKQSCLLINTADYCQATALELEEKIREKVNDEYKEKVTLQTERDLFVNVISTAITVQLRELESACEPAFSAMSRTSWSAHHDVIGPSVYTGDLVKAVEQVVDLVKPLIEQKKYARNYLDKASSLVLAKFTTALVKSRPLKETGAEQLLIDMQTIKGCLIKLPGEALTTTSYTRALTKSTARMEALLKVIVTPVDPPEAFIINYTIQIGDASFSNFQKILDLKGTPKLEQNDLLDAFLTITSTMTELDSTSFLTSLDMDPHSTSSASLGSPGGSRTALPIDAGVRTPPNGVAGGGEQKREVFSDFKRFAVSFGRRRDTAG